MFKFVNISIFDFMKYPPLLKFKFSEFKKNKIDRVIAR